MHFLIIFIFSSGRGGSSPSPPPPLPQNQPGNIPGGQDARDLAEGSGEADEIGTQYNLVDQENAEEDGGEQIVVQLPPQLQNLHFPHTPKGMTLALTLNP